MKASWFDDKSTRLSNISIRVIKPLSLGIWPRT
jgi:hypothetical protein